MAAIDRLPDGLPSILRKVCAAGMVPRIFDNGQAAILQSTAKA